MTYISQSAIRTQLNQIKQSLYRRRLRKPDFVFITNDEELEKAKKEYGENLDEIIVLRWNR